MGATETGTHTCRPDTCTPPSQSLRVSWLSAWPGALCRAGAQWIAVGGNLIPHFSPTSPHCVVHSWHSHSPHTPSMHTALTHTHPLVLQHTFKPLTPHPTLYTCSHTRSHPASHTLRPSPTTLPLLHSVYAHSLPHACARSSSEQRQRSQEDSCPGLSGVLAPLKGECSEVSWGSG